MKILLCHNYYQQPGGEDFSFTDEARLLKSRGHSVIEHTVHNEEVEKQGRLRTALGASWSSRSYRTMRQLLRIHRPDVLHCTNTFPLLSPSIYYAARKENTPVVQALRNYRLVCPGALLMREGKPCGDCLGRFPLPALRHGCYRDSRTATAAVVGMLALHRTMGTFRRRVDQYYTLTQFAWEKLVEGGLPAKKLSVKPNFIFDPPEVGSPSADSFAVYVGRLSAEKGIETLLTAWNMPGKKPPLCIVGDGPLANCVQQAAENNPLISWLGSRPLPEVLEIVGKASVLIFPSQWYETFGRTIMEAFAKGTPVVASNIGAPAELVEEGRTGRLFIPGDAADLSRVVNEFCAEPEKLAAMRSEVRREFEEKYTAQANYEMLMDIYRRAILARGNRLPEELEAPQSVNYSLMEVQHG